MTKPTRKRSGNKPASEVSAISSPVVTSQIDTSAAKRSTKSKKRVLEKDADVVEKPAEKRKKAETARPVEKRKRAEKSVPSKEYDDVEDEDTDRQYWLMKAEPESRIEKGRDVKFSIDDLAAKTEPEAWDGEFHLYSSCNRKTLDSRLTYYRCQKPFGFVDLYTLEFMFSNPETARNNMRAMMKGDLAFFYHSNCKIPGIAGIMEIVQEHSIDGKFACLFKIVCCA